MNPDEQRLVRALTDEAAGIEPSDALATIQARMGVAEPDPAAVLQFESAHRRRQLRNGVVAGVLAVGMAAAATIFAVTGGIRNETAPDPAKSPVSTATNPVPSPTPTSSVSFDPPRPGIARTVYRVEDHPTQTGGEVRVFTEYVRNLPPYAPRQSLDALFTEPPVSSAYSTVISNGRNKVASTSETDAALRVDMSAVDTGSDPQGTADDARTAAIYVQTWVDTLQDAYHSDKPVLITLKGKPTTLYGFVDTSRPISRDKTVEPIESHDIFLPRAGEKVTSPIDLAASTPDGDYQWQVVNLDTGFKPDVAGMGGSGGFSSMGAIDLPAGPYLATLLSQSDSKTPSFKRSVTFTVTGNGTPAPSTSPVTDPPVGALTLTPVFFPDPVHSSLVEEWRPRTTAVAALQTVLDGASGSDRVDHELWRSWKVASVTATSSVIEVVFTGGPKGGQPGAGNHLALDAVEQTLNGYFGTDLPITPFVAGRGLTRFPQIPAASLRTTRAAEPFVPISDTTVSSPVAIVGGMPDRRSTALWYISDDVTEEPLFQGVAPVNADQRGYAFSLDLPPGRYNLTVETTSTKKRRMLTLSVFTVR